MDHVSPLYTRHLKEIASLYEALLQFILKIILRRIILKSRTPIANLLYRRIAVVETFPVPPLSRATLPTGFVSCTCEPLPGYRIVSPLLWVVPGRSRETLLRYRISRGLSLAWTVDWL